MRFICSSGALLKMLSRHHTCPVAFSIAAYENIHVGTLTSDGLTNWLPIEALRASSVTTQLPLIDTLRALSSIEDQPITLDLHENTPNRIYASRRVDTVQGWENFHIELDQA